MSRRIKVAAAQLGGVTNAMSIDNKASRKMVLDRMVALLNDAAAPIVLLRRSGGTLPEDLAPGMHNLRVSLRGNDHHALGIEHSVDIEVVDSEQVDADALIDVNSWQYQSAADDSLAAHRPGTVECPDNSWYNEDGALEVETGFCNYLSVAQPSLAPISAGDTLHLVLWHGNLAFNRPASAHAAITVDGNVVWQANVDIPSDAEIFDLRIPVDFDAPAGRVVEYHLHNHGYNTWTLLQLDVER